MAGPARQRPVPAPIFPTLSGGAGAPSPERVATHQRARLMGAMVEAVQRSGYAGVTIRELAGLAGVSKSAFYRHFDSKQECFTATFEEIVAEGERRVGEAYREGEGLQGRLRAGLGAFAATIAAEPAAARLALIDSLALGAAGVAQREAAAERFEVLVVQSFASEGAPLTRLQARAIVAGWRRVAFRSLRAWEPQRFATHLDELVVWALSHRGATEAAVPLSTPTPPSSGQGIGWSEPPNSELARRSLDRRARILRAVAQIAAEQGYGALGVAAVSERAGTSNEAWYQHFDSKREAFGAAFAELAAEALTVSVVAFEAQPNWRQGVAAGLAVLLRHIAAEPLFARLAFFELPASGAEGLASSDVAIGSFTAYLRPSSFDAPAPELPAVTREAIAGGIWAVIQHELARGRAEELPALAPQLAALALAPFEA